MKRQLIFSGQSNEDLFVRAAQDRKHCSINHTGKNNGFPFLDILGYLKNTHKNPKVGKVRQVPTWEFPTSSQIGTCLTLPNLGFLWVFFKYPKISKNGNPFFFLWARQKAERKNATFRFGRWQSTPPIMRIYFLQVLPFGNS